MLKAVYFMFLRILTKEIVKQKQSPFSSQYLIKKKKLENREP